MLNAIVTIFDNETKDINGVYIGAPRVIVEKRMIEPYDTKIRKLDGVTVQDSVFKFTVSQVIELEDFVVEENKNDRESN